MVKSAKSGENYKKTNGQNGQNGERSILTLRLSDILYVAHVWIGLRILSRMDGLDNLCGEMPVSMIKGKYE